MLTDKLLRAAQDPSALCMITPLGWCSPLRPGVVWPSGVSTGSGFAEQIGLVTLNNIIVAGGHFAAANNAASAGIKTRLDFRGNTTSKTFLACAYLPKHEYTGTALYIHPMISQGEVNRAYTAHVFGLSLWEYPQSGTYTLYGVLATTDNALGVTVNLPASIFDGWHDFGYGIDLDAVPGRAVLRLYVDGDLVGSYTSTVAVSAFGSGALSSLSDHVGVREDANGKYGTGTLVSAAMIFEGALPASKLSYLHN